MAACIAQRGGSGCMKTYELPATNMSLLPISVDDGAKALDLGLQFADRLFQLCFGRLARRRSARGFGSAGRVTGQSHGLAVDDGRGIEPALWTFCGASECRVQGFVCVVSRLLDGMSTVQPELPAHQLVWCLRLAKKTRDGLDLTGRHRRHRTALPAVSCERPRNAVAH